MGFIMTPNPPKVLRYTIVDEKPPGEALGGVFVIFFDLAFFFNLTFFHLFFVPRVGLGKSHKSRVRREIDCEKFSREKLGARNARNLGK